ncbi:uncharacterized protein F5147DRAFT_654315 [Suillus discolor]|uniref:Uncharacterized protein n=1 Tax=Suillus discolor TaxID=1912936 RepID=A0A9P7F3U4_9AGAM|nr:uncharacterized protein F5147DRAFT_654315 [Suillus discolor]KAG2104642.1 hypothetical protein F5147DRAFT_654315 [Suillus discolor]
MTILQILATQAPDGDISSTNAIVIHHKNSLLSHPSVEYNSGLKRSHSVATNESTYFFQLLERCRWRCSNIRLGTNTWTRGQRIGTANNPFLIISTYILQNMPMVTLTDAGCNITMYALTGANVVITVMLGVIMIARLHAMYQGSRMMLIFLVIVFLAVNIASGVISSIDVKYIVAGSTIGDCFRVLIQSHVLYFARVSPEFLNPNFIGSQMLNGALQILLFVQMFVMGPRLILSVREYHAKFVACSDAETSMNSIVFQEHTNLFLVVLLLELSELAAHTCTKWQAVIIQNV